MAKNNKGNKPPAGPQPNPINQPPEGQSGSLFDFLNSKVFWQVVFSVLGAGALAAIGFFFTTIWKVNNQLVMLESVPDDLKSVNTRLIEVEKGVARLDTLPDAVKGLAQDTKEVRDDIATIRGAREKLEALEQSADAVSREVADLRTKATEQGKVTERATAQLKMVSDGVENQLKELETIKQRIAQVDAAVQVRPMEGKRSYFQFTLKEKPDELPKEKGHPLVFRQRIPFPPETPFQEMAVEHIELNRGEGETTPTSLLITGQLDLEKQELVISLYSPDSETLLAQLSKHKAVATVTLRHD